MLLLGADRIDVVSDDLADCVLALDSTVAAKMTPICYGVDLALFAPAWHAPCTPSSVPKQGKIILSMGQFISKKGHDGLVRAFALVAREVSRTWRIVSPRSR
jgi:glycosyltransferase involved in cell wall biosynthesis